MVLPCASTDFSSDKGGTSAGGGSGGRLKKTVAIQEPRVMGLVSSGPDVMVITAALVMSPPILGSSTG